MKKTIRNIVAPSLFAFAVFTTAAWAQTTEPAAAASTASAPGHHHGQKRADIVEERISELHSELKITAAQSKQWDALAQTMRDNARNTDQAFHDRSGKLATMNADESMKSYAALAQQHAQNMQKLSAALSDLYAVLSPEQKQIADELYRNKLSKGPHGHGGHPHHDAAPASATSAS